MRWKYAFINYLFDRLFQERYVVRRAYDSVHILSVSFVSPQRGGLFSRLVFFTIFPQKIMKTNDFTVNLREVTLLVGSEVMPNENTLARK